MFGGFESGAAAGEETDLRALAGKFKGGSTAHTSGCTRNNHGAPRRDSLRSHCERSPPVLSTGFAGPLSSPGTRSTLLIGSFGQATGPSQRRKPPCRFVNQTRV